jgi:hypothetical protein
MILKQVQHKTDGVARSNNLLNTFSGARPPSDRFDDVAPPATVSALLDMLLGPSAASPLPLCTMRAPASPDAALLAPPPEADAAFGTGGATF